MSHFILYYDYPPDVLERRAPHREAHLALYRRWREEGRLVMGGAVGDPPHGAVIVFDVEDRAEVEEFAAVDPYVTEGVATGRRIEPWKVV